MKKPKTKIVVPYFRGDAFRERNLVEVLRYYSERSKAEIVVVEATRDVRSSVLESLLEREGIPNVEVVKLELAHRQGFCKSRTWNVGIRHVLKSCGGNDVVILLDNDIIVDERFLENPDKVMGDAIAIHPFNKIKDLDEFETFEFLTRTNKTFTAEDFSRIDELRSGIRCYGGVLFIRAWALLLAGGFDENFQVWGHEDDVFYYALRAVHGSERVLRKEGLILHFFHPKSNTDEHLASEEYREASRYKDSITNLLGNGKAKEYLYSLRVRNFIRPEFFKKCYSGFARNFR